MKSLTKNIWRSSITQSVKIRLYVLPVLLYGSEIWDVTVKSGKRLDAFDQLVPSTYSANSLHRPRHQPGSSDEDHKRALNAGIDDPPKDWSRQTWLRTIENDLKQQNLGLWSARHRAYDRKLWREIVETATLLQGHAT